MAAPRRRTERSESAAERARKAPRPTDSRRTFTPRRRKGAQSAAHSRAHRSTAFPTIGAAKTAHTLAPLRGGKSPRAAERAHKANMCA